MSNTDNENRSEFRKINSILKRYSFYSKVSLCHKADLQILGIGKLNYFDDLVHKISPWELETFMVFSIFNDEWKSDDLTYRRFIKVINVIRNHRPDNFEGKVTSNPFYGLRYLSALACKQFSYQEDNFIKMYRFNYIFNFCNQVINVREEFFRYFGFEYPQILTEIYCLMAIFIKDMKLIYLSKEIIDNISPEIINLFTKSRAEHKDAMEEYNILDDKCELKISSLFTYPFIAFDNNVFLPLPHLLIPSVTEGLLYRLTGSNKELKPLIGKEVYEKYLFEILSETNIYNKVIKEQTYRDGRQ